MRRLGHDPLQMLMAERKVKILGDTLILLIALWMATRLLGLGVAVLGFCLLALDPFLIAHARLLHVDALVSSFMMLSVLALIAYQRCGQRRRDLVISGIAAGLAWLTRSPALFLIPYTGLLLLLDFWINRPSHHRFMHGLVRPLLQTFLLWFGAAAAVTFAMWPALWVQPVDTATSIIEWAYDAATEGHERSTFFLGRIIANGDPGWLFYPVSYLWRATPVTQLGILLAVLGLALPRTQIIPASLRAPVAQLLLFALLFMAMMSLGAKKFDRYVLPSYLPLNLAAAAGWYGVLRALHRAQFRLAPIAAIATAALIMAAQGLSAVSAYPYYLSYYNPLLGGAQAAERAMLVGWGEGMDQVARFIKAQPDGADAIVRTDAWREPLIFYLPNTIHTDAFPPNAAGRRRWMQTDYFVTYVAMWQRDTVAPSLQHYLDRQKPVLTVTIDGAVYARVYDLRRIPVPEWYFQG